MFKTLILALLVIATGANAAPAPKMTKDETLLFESVVLKLFSSFYSDEIQKASVAKIQNIIPTLAIRLTDANGKVMDEANLPAALANMKADLQNTDIEGELKRAGIKVLDSTSRGQQVPEMLVYIFSLPANNSAELKTRKMYVALGVISRFVTMGDAIMGKRLKVTIGTYGGTPIFSTGDDTTDAQNIRVSVRSLVNKFTADATAK